MRISAARAGQLVLHQQTLNTCGFSLVLNGHDDDPALSIATTRAAIRTPAPTTSS
jgi:hypothetical protein